MTIVEDAAPGAGATFSGIQRGSCGGGGSTRHWTRALPSAFSGHMWIAGDSVQFSPYPCVYTGTIDRVKKTMAGTTFCVFGPANMRYQYRSRGTWSAAR
jgi:hypothetical protein